MDMQHDRRSVWSTLSSRSAAILLTALFSFSLPACGDDDDEGTFCPEGQVRREGVCEDYMPGNPVSPGNAWQPGPGTTWQWQLTDPIDPSLNVEMYDVDLFNVTDDELAALAGKIIICYFSAGSWEAWRDDAGSFPSTSLGNTLEGWPDERWIDITSTVVREIMLDRLDFAASRGCDGVEPDNMDGYANDNGLGLNATEQLDYNRFIADAAHERGLSVGLKNDLDQLEELLPWYDWALNEECHAYGECGLYDSTFSADGKAVFHVEYVDDWTDAPDLADEVCGLYPDLSTLIKTWDLGPEFLSCD